MMNESKSYHGATHSLSRMFAFVETTVRLLGLISVIFLTYASIRSLGLESLTIIFLIILGLSTLVLLPLAVIWLLVTLLGLIFNLSKEIEEPMSISPAGDNKIKPVDDSEKVTGQFKFTGKKPPSRLVQALLMAKSIFIPNDDLFARSRVVSYLGLFSLLVWLLVAWFAPGGLERRIFGLAWGFGLMFLIWLFSRLTLSGKWLTETRTEDVVYLDIAGSVFATALVCALIFGLYWVTVLGIIYLVYGTREINGQPTFLMIFTFVYLLFGAKLLSSVQAFLGVGAGAEWLLRKCSTNDPWWKVPDPDGTFWARQDDLNKVWLFFLVALPPLIIIGGSGYHFGFFK